MVTIQDVARAAGVSPMTVSNVMNERGRVGPTTRAKVLDTIDALGYRVNVAARNLRQGRTGTIGLALPELDRAYSSQLAARIVRAGMREGLRVVVEETGARKENELDAIALSRLRLYDGLILSAVDIETADLEHMSASGPVVLLGEKVSATRVDHVGVPNVDGARAMLEHLRATGRRRIAVLGASVGFREKPDAYALEAGALRIRGARQALQAAGSDVDPDLVIEVPEWSIRAGWEATTEFLQRGQGFDAIFALMDSLAFGALRALADAGLSVPHDVAVAGFDDVEEARFSIPSLTTVAPDHRQIAETAVRFLVERMTVGDDAGPPRDVTSDFHIAVRESTSAGPRDGEPRAQ
ncbi:MAG TPA: LacI family DNA-binding transcriptional regulator [Actinomycetales bacterium]|nr:LacI family DNA-binding transcriptional regulator [Actinomycetales bacterium]